MVARAPRFWWMARPNLVARALSPIGLVYGSVTARRMARTGRSVTVPVICIGNFVAGGAGKTPAALTLARRLLARGRRPAFLSRGYGGNLGRAGFGQAGGVTRVDPLRHGAAAVGDEPLLLARLAPTYVAADRLASAQWAIRAGADVLVLDDGLQNPRLHKNLSIVMVDGATGIGNGLCVPAGPLRAPLARQWPAVGLVCVVGEGTPGAAVARQAEAAGIGVLQARIEAEPAAVQALAGQRLLAFAGIGRPEKFFATLDQHGLEVVGRRAFADHHPYGPADVLALLSAAEALDARLVTTEKDLMRLPPDLQASSLPVSLAFEDGVALDRALAALGL